MNEFIEDKTGRRFMEVEGKRYNCTGYVGETRVGYMCSTDFNTEMGNHACLPNGMPDGNKVYDSLEELRQARGCVKECGHVKVLVVALEFGRERNESGAQP